MKNESSKLYRFLQAAAGSWRIAIFIECGNCSCGGAGPCAGFLLAAGIQRWGLDKRIALKTMQFVGTSPGAIIAGVMIATGFISMWVSNTATAAMMVPIAIAVMSVVRQNSDSPTITKGERNFGICVLLAVAYGASIGGMGTIIGSPPNGIFVRFVQQTYGVDVSIVQWMKVG